MMGFLKWGKRMNNNTENNRKWRARMRSEGGRQLSCWVDAGTLRRLKDLKQYFLRTGDKRSRMTTNIVSQAITSFHTSLICTTTS